MLNTMEKYFLDLIKGQKTGVVASILRLMLLVISWFYQFLVSLRNWAFDKGWVRKYSPPVPVVISIGNIVAGGTGKTPVTLMLAKEFYDNATLAILARGYRAKAENLSAPVVLSRGQGPMHPASYCGDEPYMLSLNLPKALMFVGKDRYKSCHMAAKAGAQLILLDDGMQHRRVARDFEVVVMDARDPFGQGYYLPRGLLRENLKALGRADLIVLNHVQDHHDYVSIRQKIAHYTTAPVAGTRPVVSEVLDLSGKKIASLRGVKVGLFCGIAHPDYFQRTVLDEGAEIIDTYTIADHNEFDPDQLVEFAVHCKELGAEYLICTEKDRVKIVDSLETAVPILWVRMHLQFVEGQSAWQSFIDRAKGDLAQRL